MGQAFRPRHATVWIGFCLHGPPMQGVYYLTIAVPKKPPKDDPKLTALRARGAANPSPERVQDDLFASGDFFDRRDLVQVKYEMLRRVRVDEWSIGQAATAYGFSRPTFYSAQESLTRAGLPGLLPRKRGPKKPRKLTDTVMAFVHGLRSEDPSLDVAALVTKIEERFGLSVHPRSVERALKRLEKKRL